MIRVCQRFLGRERKVNGGTIRDGYGSILCDAIVVDTIMVNLALLSKLIE